MKSLGYNVPIGGTLVSNRGLFGTSLSQAGRDFRRAVVHIGEEIKKVFDESGLTKRAFAEKIGRHHNKINDVFTQVSCDSLLLQRIGEVLHFDFFTFYTKAAAKPYGEPGGGTNVVSESAPIAPPKVLQPPIQLLVNIDPNDPELEKKVRQLTRILGGK